MLRIWRLLLEQWACNELLPRFPDICGFREKNYEIDFIQKTHNQIIPIECKAALKTKESHLTGLKKYMQEYTLDVGVVVNAAPFEKRTFPFGAIFACPLYAVEALPEILAGTQ